jgi:hypothetical protein
VERLKDKKVRAYIYGVLAALLPILVVYGYVDDSQVGLYLTLAAAVLAAGSEGAASVLTFRQAKAEEASEDA